MSCWISKLSSEILLKIFSSLSAKTLLNVTETCKWLKEFVLESNSLWERLCFEDFLVFLKVKGPFPSFFAIYQAIYKYDIVQRQIYDEKCQLTFFCDVFNLPDYLYHWCMLLNQCSMHWPLSRTILKKDKFKKMWGLQDADIAGLPCGGSGVHVVGFCDYFRSKGFTWKDGLDASVLRYGHIKKFQEVALQRCKKSLKRIEKKFKTAARVLRVEKLLTFFTNNNNFQNVKNLLIREDKNLYSEVYFDDEEEDFVDEDISLVRTPSSTEDSCKIGVDYARGLLHKTGFQQIVNFSFFCKDLTTKCKALPQFTEEDIKQCTQFVYKKLSHKAREKLISSKQFMKCAETYQGRIDRVWEWQCEKGEEHQREYRGQKVKSHESYKSYFQGGDKKEFSALKTYFDGIEKLKKWIKENKWMEQIVKPQIINIVQGSLTEEVPGDQEERAVYRLVRQYLKTGTTRDFNKTLLKLSKMSKKYLKAHKGNVRKLELSIPIPIPLRLKAMKHG